MNFMPTAGTATSSSQTRIAPASDGNAQQNTNPVPFSTARLHVCVAILVGSCIACAALSHVEMNNFEGRFAGTACEEYIVCTTSNHDV